ncbi:MAG: DUF4249 family protein [Bacteroidota bacterium]
MKFRYVLIALLSLLISCEVDITEEFQDSQQNVFIVSGQLVAFEHPTINLTRSITMTQVDTLLYLNNARVEVSWSDQTLLLEPVAYGNYTTEELVLQPGVEYYFHFSGEGLPDASATVTIPHLPKISELHCAVDDTFNIHLDLSIEDPAEFEDYYTFYISGWLREIHVNHHGTDEETRDTLNVFTNYRLNIQDPVFEYTGDLRDFQVIEEEEMFYSIFHFSDLLFNGTTHTLSIDDYLRRFYNDSIPEINIHLVKRDAHYFKFMESMLRYDPYNDLPMIQPVQIYSNIEGGFGLITANSPLTQTINMSEWYYDPEFLEMVGK